MTCPKSILFIAFFIAMFLPDLFSQQTYFGADNKFTSLLDTKYLKNGDIVLLEQVSICSGVRVKILKPNGIEEHILSSGRLNFHSFNELIDNNWVLTLITDPSDDVPTPFTFHTITFIEDDYSLFSLNNGDETSIPLDEIRNSAVINTDELVLIDNNKKVYFTDFELSTINQVTLNENLRLMKSPVPQGGFLYYQYIGADEINSTENRFGTEQLLAFDLGSSFRDLHYLGNYAIFQDETEISALEGIFGFQYIEQDKIIYNYRQHGQNLTYYTVLDDNTITFNKIYLDENEVLQKDNFDIVVSDLEQVPHLHWDGNFKGITITNNFTPLSSEYPDDYRGNNYILNYNLNDFDLNTQNLDITIEDIEYTITKIDTVVIDPNILLFNADISMEITITNNTDEVVNDVHLYSSAYEGFNCTHNGLKVDEDIISIDPNSSRTLTSKYESLDFDNLDYFDDLICVYAIGANNKFDEDFDDNIFCLNIEELTSTSDEINFEEFSIAPNPAQGFVQLIDESAINSKYQVYSLQGQLIDVWKKTSSKDRFDTSALNQGTYIVINTVTNSKVLFTKI